MSYRDQRRKKGLKGSTIGALIAAGGAIAALAIMIGVLGNPSGDKKVSSADAQPTTQSTAADADKEKETGKDEKETKKEESSGKEKESEKETEKETKESSDGKKTNPKNYEEAIDKEREAEKRVYLSFDDGPSAVTEDILDILKKYDVKATFYNVATDSDEYLSAEKRAYEEGHTIAIHTVSHDYSEVYSSFEAWKADVLGEQENIKNNIGVTTKYYRFPGGSSNSMGVKYGTDINQCVKWLDENGFIYQDWNVSNDDAEGISFTADELVQNVVDPILNSNGTDYMVLMHDSKAKQTTVDSLPKLIETLKAEGYTFCQMTDNTKVFHHKIYEG